MGIDIGQRERKLINGNLEVGTKVNREFKRTKILSAWRLKNGGGYTHQFFDNAKLDRLEQKEKKWDAYLEKLQKEKDRENGIESHDVNGTENGNSNDSYIGKI